MRQMQRIKAGVDGLLVMRVKEVSPAADAGIQEGDIITAGQRPEGRDDRGLRQDRRRRRRRATILKLYVYNPRANVSRFALVKIDD